MRVIDIALSEPDQIRINALLTEVSQKETDRRRKKEQGQFADVAFWSIQRIPKCHNEYNCDDRYPCSTIKKEEIASLAAISTGLTALPSEKQSYIINWGYLSAHFGLPFLNKLFWSDSTEVERILGKCSLPEIGRGISAESDGEKAAVFARNGVLIGYRRYEPTGSVQNWGLIVSFNLHQLLNSSKCRCGQSKWQWCN